MAASTQCLYMSHVQLQGKDEGFFAFCMFLESCHHKNLAHSVGFEVPFQSLICEETYYLVSDKLDICLWVH